MGQCGFAYPHHDRHEPADPRISSRLAMAVAGRSDRKQIPGKDWRALAKTIGVRRVCRRHGSRAGRGAARKSGNGPLEHDGTVRPATRRNPALRTI
jgi:hypothetical protein